MSKKIGKDVLQGKGSAIISSPKESEEFEEWKAEQQEEKEERPKFQVELKSKMPSDEGEPTIDELAKEREELQAEMEKLKAIGKLKVQNPEG